MSFENNKAKEIFLFVISQWVIIYTKQNKNGTKKKKQGITPPTYTYKYI